MADTANLIDADFVEAPTAKIWAKFAYVPEVTGTGWMVCKVAGCESTVRSRWGTLCNTHYFRGRRTGTTATRERSAPGLSSHGYMVQSWKGHPAASPKGMLYEHRKVFYEAFGPDGHHCCWCNKGPLKWGGKVGANKLNVDHRNGSKVDNRPENLLPSCNRCNVNRGLFMSWIARHQDDPVLREIFERQATPANDVPQDKVA